MRLITRYVVGEVLLVFTITLVALTGFLVLVLAVTHAINEGWGLGQIMQALPILLPMALMFSVPGTMLYAVSFVYGRMSASNEIVALKSMGISPMTVLWPALMLSAILSLATVWLNDMAMSWTPRAVKQVASNALEEIAYSMLRTKKSYSSPSFSVTVWKVEGHTLVKPIFFFTEGNKQARLQADSAELHSKPGSGKLTITFVNPSGEMNDTSFHVNDVVEREIDISGKGTRPKPQNYALREIGRAMEEQLDLIRSIEDRMVARTSFDMLTGDFDALAGGGWNDDAGALQNAKFNYYKMRTEPPRRWANGFSCICFVLVGAAMAIRRRHADALTSFFLCFLPILVMYYPLLMFAKDRANAGQISPYWVWLANGIMLLWGLWLWRRVVRY